MSGASTSLPLDALGDYLRAQGLAGTGPLAATVLAGGQSNPTFRITTAEGRNYVLRKKPPGALIASAHAIDREYRVMRALQDTAVPVPRMLAYCDDAALLGTPFYVMEFLQGRVLMDQSLPGMDPAERTAIYREMNRVIAALHAVDYAAVGLADYGKPGNYVGRQVARWSRQCREATVPVTPAMERLMDWLPQHLPQDDETTLVHGDYRLDNLVFHPSEPRVIGVLDWELSTLGHPLADFSYHCMSWHIPQGAFRGIGGVDIASLGIPSEQDYIRRYCERTGFTSPEQLAPDWNFYLAYNMFRIAAILQGIAKRVEAGTASSAQARASGAGARPMAELAWGFAQKS